MALYEGVRMGITREAGSLRVDEGSLVWTSKSGTTVQKAEASEIKSLEWMAVDSRNKMLKVVFTDKTRPHHRYVGFAQEDETKIDKVMREKMGKKLSARAIDVGGCNWGQFVLRPQEIMFRAEKGNKNLVFTIPYSTVKQSVIQARNEVSIEFNEAKSDTVRRRTDQLCEMRIFVPDDNDHDSKHEAFEDFHETLIKKASLQVDKTEIIARFEKIVFKVPRGRYQIQFFPNHFLFRGETYSYQIDYTQIKRLFIFNGPDSNMSFLIQLSPPIRQGQMTYHYLIMECPEDEFSSVPINASEEDLKNKYTSHTGAQLLKQQTEGPTYDVLSRVFMGLSKTKIIQAKNFRSADKSGNNPWIRCSLGQHQGLLYPLEKSMFFIYKPATYFRHSDIRHVEFKRIHDALQAKMFDFEVTSKKGDRKFMFTGIDKSEYEVLAKYCMDPKKRITVLGAEEHRQALDGAMSGNSRSTRTRKNLKRATQAVNVDFGDDDEDEDEDYDIGADKEQLDEDERDDEDFDQLVEDDFAGDVDMPDA